MTDSFQSRRVLITGAAGFVGANLTHTLAAKGAEVHALIRPGTDLWRLKPLKDQIHLHSADLRDFSAVRTLLTEIQPEYIFHMAKALASNTLEQRMTALQTNVIGLFNLLEAAQDIDYKQFVCGASSLEYGKQPQPMVESDCPNPSVFFGATKAAATILCRQYAEATQRPISILRFFSVYGPWESPQRFIPTAIVAALMDKELPLTDAGYCRDFIFVDDVVRACLLVAEKPVVPGEIINIGSGEQTSNEAVAALIERLSERNLRVQVGAYPAHEADTTDWVADNSKAARLFGWTPEYSLDAGLKKTIHWLEQHLSLYEAQGSAT